MKNQTGYIPAALAIALLFAASLFLAQGASGVGPLKSWISASVAPSVPQSTPSEKTAGGGNGW